MKKSLLLIVALIVANIISAQSQATLDHHCMGNYMVYLHDIMEMRNGSIVASTRLFSFDGQEFNDYAYCFLNLSREDASVVDSTVVEADYTNSSLLESNPIGDGYLLINNEYDYDYECSYLKIRHFDENFNFLEDQQTVLPFDDTLFGGESLYLPEGEDFIMCYTKSGNLTLARYGIDGTQKDKTVISDSTEWPHNAIANDMKLWNDTPREYAVWGKVYRGDTTVVYLCVFDSLLQIKESVKIGSAFEDNFQLEFTKISFESLSDSTYLMSCGYTYWNGYSHDWGVLVVMRDKESHENLKRIKFEFPIPDGTPYTIDMAKNDKEEIFVAYGDTEGYNSLAVAKLSADLNVIWQRNCMQTRMWEHSVKMKLLSDGGVAIPVCYHGVPGHISVVIVNDDYDGISGQDGVSVRPYGFWPNPAKDILNLQYSPDVTPTRIELFDLQGRLVRSQTTGLESVGMEGLATGTYTLRVTLEGGKTFSDKVVKE